MLLLVIDAPADDSLFLPSKLIDYLPLRRPILGLTPLRGASADLIRRLGYPVVAPDDEAAIAGQIEALLDLQSRPAGLAPSPMHDTVTAEHDIRRTTGAFADILARCHVKPRVLMVTGAYYPETSGGGLQARTVDPRASRPRGLLRPDHVRPIRRCRRVVGRGRDSDSPRVRGRAEPVLEVHSCRARGRRRSPACRRGSTSSTSTASHAKRFCLRR